jgi:protein O-mannosyl-transferase
MTKRMIKDTGSITLLAVIGVLLYMNTLESPFIFDDGINIVENPHIRMTAIAPDQIAQIKHSICPRPFANFTFALNYYFHQYQVRGYHLINILIHLVTAVLIFFIAKATLRLCRKESVWSTAPTALMAAIIWLIHPLQTQSVTYVVQRMNSLAAMFSLLALLCYINVRLTFSKPPGQIIKKTVLVTAVLVTGVLGLASKENAAILPVMLLLYEWFFFRDLSADWLKRQAWWMIVVIVAIIAAAIIYMGANPLAFLLNMYETQPFTMPQRLLTEPSVILYYLSLLFSPHPARLNLDYSFPISQSLWLPATTTLSLTTLLLLLIGSVVASKKYRLASFAILWFLITLVIESSFIGLALIFEHRTYLPSVFLVIAFTWFFMQHIKPAILTARLLIIAIICLCGFWTIQRNAVWSDAVTLWHDCVLKSPQKARTHSNLASALGKKERLLPDAIKHNLIALEINPDYAEAHLNLGTDLVSSGQYKKGISHLKTALQLSPKATDAHNNLGLAYLRLGKTQTAIQYFKKAHTMSPYNNSFLQNLKLAQKLEKQLQKVAAEMQKALSAVNAGPTITGFDQAIEQLKQARTSLDKAVQRYIRMLAYQPGFKKDALSASDIDVIQPVIKDYCAVTAALKHKYPQSTHKPLCDKQVSQNKTSLPPFKKQSK